MSNKVLTTFSTLLLLALVIYSSSPALATTLGGAQDYGILGGQTVTNTGHTIVNGDLGVSPGSAVTGFPPGNVTGTIHAGDASASAAQSGNTAAYGNLGSQSCGTTYTGTQDLTLVSPLGPGVYCADAFKLTGNLKLSGSGDWIFKSASTLVTSPGSSVSADEPCSVWWKVGSSATVDTGTKFVGNILALTSIAMNTGATLDGRALAQNGAVTLDSNRISACRGPIPPVFELSTLLLTSVGIFGLLLILRKRK